MIDGIEYRYSSEWIHTLESEEHWRSYWQQVHLIMGVLREDDTILEIGPGSGFLSNYLRFRGYSVTSLDIDEQKSPDIVANLVEYSFPDSYDHLLAFEVFEHIPFDKFIGLLPRLKQATRKNLFISIPMNYRIWFHADLIIPYFKEVSFSIKLKRRKIIADHHFWELGYRKYTQKALVRQLSRAGFRTELIRKVKLLTFFQLNPNTYL